jgi:hypothetical protein
MQRLLRACASLLTSLVLFINTAAAKEFCVRTSSGLQNALTEAATNGKDDIIKIMRGSYAGNFTFVSFEGKSIMVIGGYAADFTSRSLNPSITILDGNNTGRVLYLDSFGGGDIHVEGCKIKNGLTDTKGGGIYAASYFYDSAGKITITNNVINKNAATGGGGIFAWTDSHYVDYGFFANRQQKFPTPLSKRQKKIEMANEEAGGDIFITDNLITRNTGEGVWAYATGDLYAGSVFVSHNTVTENEGTGIVGISEVGNVHIHDNSIIGNRTDGNGGGVFAGSFLYLGTGGNIHLTNNIIAENFSINGGGVYAVTTGDYVAGYCHFVNNTISGNSCSDSGGGVLLKGYLDSMFYVHNNIIWANTAKSGGDIQLDFDPSEWVEAYGHNNDYSSMSGNWTQRAQNISVDPNFVDPVNSDYHLGSSSPCIDAGNDAAPSLPLYDFDGEPRIFDGNGDGEAKVDIGADEYIGVSLQSLTIAFTSGGTTDPTPGEHIFARGYQVTIRANPEEHNRFDGWSGDVPSEKKKDNPLILTMDIDRAIRAHFIRIIYPPLNVTVQKVLNRSLSQAEYIDVITWLENPDNQDLGITRYRIYEVNGDIWDLLAELDNATLQYWHRQVDRDRTYVYALAAVDEANREGDAVLVTIH